ncbi:hypothetical protein LWT00_22350, partial [Enterobacter hormaechei]|nr:hypothetical protein [Enterobacter hormaechei]
LIEDQNLEQQFFDTINRLSATQRERGLERLISKSRLTKLDEDENAKLLDLLRRTVPAQNPTSSGA